jgi:hypothetical protein
MYLSGLFYRLKVPTNYFFLSRSTTNLTVYSDLFFFKNFRKGSIRHLFKEHLDLIIRFRRVVPSIYSLFYARLNQLGNSGETAITMEEDLLLELSSLGKQTSKDIFLPSSNAINFQILEDPLAIKLYSNLSDIRFNLLFQNLVYCSPNTFALFYLLRFFNLSVFSMLTSNLFFGELPNLHTKSLFFSLFHQVHHHLLTSRKRVNFTSNTLTHSVVHMLNSRSISRLFKGLSGFLFMDSFFKLIISLVLLCPSKSMDIRLVLLEGLTKYYYFSKFMQVFVLSVVNGSVNQSKISYSFHKLVMVQLVNSWRRRRRGRRFFTNIPLSFTKLIIRHLEKQVERTLSGYSKLNVTCVFGKTFSVYHQLLTITNAKVVCDFVVYTMEHGIPLRIVFKRVKDLHINQYNARTTLEQLYSQTELEYVHHLSFKRFPILSLRIEGGGTVKKGTRKQRLFYGDWATEVELVNKNPSNSFYADVDYYQSYAITKSSSFGIKVWVFFKTHLYDTNQKFKSLIIY